MPSTYAAEINAATTLPQLEVALVGDPRLYSPVSEFAVSLAPREFAVAQALVGAGGELSLGTFLRREALHQLVWKKVTPQQVLAAFKGQLLQGQPRPDLAPRPLEQADAFDDLLPYVEGKALGRRRTFEVVDELPLRPALKSRVRLQFGSLHLARFWTGPTTMTGQTTTSSRCSRRSSAGCRPSCAAARASPPRPPSSNTWLSSASPI